MKQKLLDIKLILRIIISVLVIFSMLKSCAKANEITDFNSQQVYDNITAIYNNGGISQACYEKVTASGSYIFQSQYYGSSYNGYFLLIDESYFYICYHYSYAGSTIINNSNDTSNSGYNQWQACNSGFRYNLNNGNNPSLRYF